MLQLAGAALSGAAAKWKALGLKAVMDSEGKWRMQERDGGVATIEHQGRHVLAVVGGQEESEALRRLLTKILGGS